MGLSLRSVLGACALGAVLAACEAPAPDAPEAAAVDLSGTAPVTSTVAGDVQGVREGELAVFRGIPFAASTAGDNRWRAPQPVAAWDDVKAASEFAPACFQNAGPGTGGVAQDASSEDCLYLNVWSPAASSDANLPVMVWIYGGGFSAGATSTPLYSGEKLAERGVVVVSVAYRVGPMGFLAHPELSAESPDGVSGNYGLLDQIAGLKWVEENIANFGGDPDRVTIFGESAGGISVSMLAASPLAEGLFDGAISQSGGSFGANHAPPLPGENVQRLDQAEAAGVALAEKLGGDLASMRAASAGDVLTASRGVVGVGWPVMDGHVIPDDQYRLYEADRYNETPILVGFNSDEGALFGGPVTAEAHEASVRERYGPFAEEMLEVFAASGADATQASRDLATDVMFGWHTLAWARLQNATGDAPVWLYYFDNKAPYPEGSRLASAKGAPHAAELPFMFGHLDQQSTIPWRPGDRTLSEAMVGYWTNFAKTGDPNGEGLPQWPQFSNSDEEVMIFKGEPHAGELPDPAHMDVIERYMEWRRSDEGAQP